MKALVFALPLLVACGHAGIDVRWAPKDVLQYDAAQYPDDAAVGLYFEDGRFIVNRTSEPSYTQQLVHRVYAIQHERAFDLAEVRIPFYGKSKLVSLQARHTKPDGTVRELQPSEVIVDETASTDGRATKGRVFRFPNVQVGSVLEWVYVIELPYLDTDDESRSFGEHPVRRYEAWIEASKEIILEARFYNTSVTTSAGNGRDPKFRRIGASIRDIPPRPKREAYAADWTYTQPRWAYRMLRWNFGGHATPVLQTWNDVVSRWGYRAWATGPGALLETFPERLDVSRCEDVRCKVERGVLWLKEHTEYSGNGAFDDIRTGPAIIASREASAFERALLLRRLLAEAGLDVNLAAYTARHSEAFDETFPTLKRFNRILVHVPAQGGLKEELWVDPACEPCALGQVSDEAAGVRALVFKARLVQVAEFYDSEFRVVGAKGIAPPRRRVRYQAKLTPAGDITLDVFDERTGRWAVNHCAELRTTSPGSRWSTARRELLAAAPAAKLTLLPRPDCRPSVGFVVEKSSAVLPGHAVSDESRILVPLTLFDPMWATTFAEDQRVQPVALPAGDWSTELELELEAPPGWSVVSPARRETSSAPGMTATFESTPSPSGANVKLSVAVASGYHEVGEYPSYWKLGEFLRNARTRVVELQRK